MNGTEDHLKKILLVVFRLNFFYKFHKHTDSKTVCVFVREQVCIRKGISVP